MNNDQKMNKDNTCEETDFIEWDGDQSLNEPLETDHPNLDDLEKNSFSLELDYLDDQKQEDKLWQARTGLNEQSLCGAVETIIFMSERPISLPKIRALIDEDLPLRVIHEALAKLQEGYEQSFHGIRLVEVAEGYQFRTKATYSRFVQDLFKVNSLVLSPTVLEVLAIIAYKQPVSKIEVEKIRGVDSSHIVRALMDKRLVKIAGRSEEVGRPVLYATTNEFLEVFNLPDISALPPEHELEEMAHTGLGKITDIKSIVHTGDKKKFNFDEIEELDQLSENIKDISSDTEFTISLKIEEKRRKEEGGKLVKSAFELLEEHINIEQVKRANIEASKSTLFTAVTFPSVIQDLCSGPFNVPDLDAEDDFEMIDLDTGLPISSSEKNHLDEESDEFEDVSLNAALLAEHSSTDITYADEEFSSERSADQHEEDALDLFDQGRPNDNIKDLVEALDLAFSKIKLSSHEGALHQKLRKEEIGEVEEMAEQVSEEITEKTLKMKKEAADLDIDLDFLD